MRILPQALLRAIAVAILGAAYGAVLMLCRMRRRRHRAPGQPSGCILAIGTFYNPNWIHAHFRPLVRSGVGDVVLVCDEAVASLLAHDAATQSLKGLRFETPPRWMAKLLSRAGARFCWSVRASFRYRPDLYMGYHIFPSAVMALALGRMFHRPACYQATSGVPELQGGGWQMENPVLAALQRPSPLIERLVCGLVREFDSIVVRGSSAKAWIRAAGYRGSLAVITGSAEPAGPWRDRSARSIDLAFVGRLAEDKRPERFVAVAAALAKAHPRLRAVMIGDGPDAASLKSLARELGIESNLEFLGKRADVNDLLAVTRVFMLTSRTEGLSIAMLEAMAAGAVPVVSNVGDLADVVRNDINGYIVAQDDIAGYAAAASRLLSDAVLWRRCSRRARAEALVNSGVDAVARRWHSHLRIVLAGPRGEAPVAYAKRKADLG